MAATDAALDARRLARAARRAVFAMARVGANFSGGSGDYAVAFSTADQATVADDDLDALFTATMDAVEEALLNSVFTATTTHDPPGRVAHAVPVDAARTRLRRAGVLS